MYYEQSENGHLHYVKDEDDKIVKVYSSKKWCEKYINGEGK